MERELPGIGSKPKRLLSTHGAGSADASDEGTDELFAAPSGEVRTRARSPTGKAASVGTRALMLFVPASGDDAASDPKAGDLGVLVALQPDTTDQSLHSEAPPLRRRIW